MTGRQVNIYLQEKTYNAVRQLVGSRQISRYINQAVEERLAQQQKEEKKRLRERLITAYKRMTKNKNLQKELAIFEAASVNDISKKLAKDE